MIFGSKVCLESMNIDDKKCFFQGFTPIVLEQLQVKDRTIQDKLRIIAEKDTLIAEKEALIAQKDALIAQKDIRIAQLEALG